MKEKERFSKILKRDLALGEPLTYFRPAKAKPHVAAAYCRKGAQSHAEWEELGVLGPNYGRNAKFQEVGVPPKDPGEKGLVKQV